jgi:apolipoprotein N-acyltransferase
MGRFAVAMLLGAATVIGFAPLALFPLPLVTIAALLWLMQKAASARQAGGLGFGWGLGFFVGGVSWVYVSLHDVGGMAAPLAALATLLFCLWLALFPALAGYGWFRWRRRTAWRDGLLFAGLWTLAECLRGWLFTGFPWLSLGYSQTPPSPLAGYAPVLGVYGVGFMVALAAALIAVGARRPAILGAVVAIVGIGSALRMVEWSRPVGAPISVSLLQGNIAQTLKWDPERLPLSVDTYVRLAATHPAQLTVLPETAIPQFLDEIPRETLRQLTRHGALLMGVALKARPSGYVNGAVALGADLSNAGAYAKAHLVPFGEYVPPGFWWFFDWVNIPMSDFSAGPARQAPLAVGGQTVGPNICYEDLFGEELLHALPQATLLVNLSNTAWFGDSLAQPQHLQIARMRAMETGRPMLRATNTGMTAAIAPDGAIIAALPAFVRDGLTVSVRGYQGTTPYVVVGNAAALALAVLASFVGTRGKRRYSPD